MSNHIQYPFAEHSATKKEIHITQVNSSNKNNLICLGCKQIMIPVNHKTPHFRHKIDANCKPESYIHKLAKKAFLQMKEISFPQINKSDIPFNIRINFEDYIHELVIKQAPKSQHDIFKESLKNNLSESQTFNIQKVEIEKTYKTPLGDVRIDVVLTINNQIIFIEPYYTNSISEAKLKKLELLNIPTISIPLHPFLSHFTKTYKIEDLIRHLQLKHSKDWVHIRPKSLNVYIKNYYRYVHIKLEQNQSSYGFYKQNQKLIKSIELKIYDSLTHIDYLNDQIKTIKDNPFLKYQKLLQKFIK